LAGSAVVLPFVGADRAARASLRGGGLDPDVAVRRADRPGRRRRCYRVADLLARRARSPRAARLAAGGPPRGGSGLMHVVAPRAGWMIRDGWMDRILLRPVSPLLQVMLFQFRANGIGDLVVGLIAFAKALSGIDVAWTPLAVADLFLVITGSMLLEAGLLLAIAA